MTTQVITVKPTDTVRQAVIKMALDNVTGAPVVDNRNHVLGLITQTDILKLILHYQDMLDRAGEGDKMLLQPLDEKESDPDVSAVNQKFSDMKVSDIMIRSILYTTPDAEVIEALRIMMKMDVGRLTVLEQGVLVGTVSRSDVIFAIYKKKA